MANIDYNIFEIEPEGLSGFRTLSNEDNQLLTSAEITKTFKPNDNFIELSFYTLDNIRLQTIGSYSNYSVISGDTKTNEQGNAEIAIDPQQDYLSYGFQGQEVKLLYNFLDYSYSTTTNPQDFYIESISPDRTELRLVSVNLGASEVLDTTNQLIESFNNQAYTPDLNLYFGNNIFYSIVNIDVEEFRETNAVLIKLYNPLPSAVRTKVRLNIVEKISESVAFEINTLITPEEQEIPTLRGANFDVEIEEQSTEPSQYYNYVELFSFPTNNSYRELNSLFNEKGAELSVDYSDFSNFINFSSAEERLLNFKYKLDLINSYQSSLDNINAAGINYSNTGITGSRVYYENLLNGVINNLDHYERHLYFESGSTSWPKSNSTKPYINQQSSETEAINWYSSEIQDAILFDAQNPNILTNTIPTFLKEDSNNQPYELFIHMIAQHFDNLWLYTDSVSKKYDADNRLNRGVSKDLVEELLKNFGIKLYTSNKSVEDLFKYFTVNSYDIGEEYLPTGITTSGQKPVSQNDYQKEIYKRIYHNLPLLFKSKGTERGLRALINCFGIPSDILKIKIYGGQSANDLPFFGGEQAWTSSLDKVRLDNTGSITQGDTLSFYTSINKKDNIYTQDLHRIEVGFSPADNINSYILSQSAVLFPDDPFNIDEYIGDPRQSETNKYIPLKSYADKVFENIGSYNLKDFVRLIKFFDNVIFRMVRDFVPARSVADTGIIIKPHLLERNKHISPVMTWTRPEYSGSIDTAFITGSDGGIYTLGSSTNHTKTVITPTGPEIKKWTSSNGTISTERSHEEAKYDGELSNAQITVTDGEINNENPYKQINYPLIRYDVSFLEAVPEGICIIQAPESEYIVTQPSLQVNLATIFSGVTGEYSFNVNGNPANTSYLVQGNQYDQFIVQATHSNSNLENLVTGEQTCEATRNIRIVLCDLTNTIVTGPPEVSPNQVYNLEEWFTLGLNTQVHYYINDQLVEDPQNVTFNNISDDTVLISVRDEYDEACGKNYEVSFNSCPLVDNNNLRNAGGLSILSDNFVPPYGFQGTSNTTQFFFKLRVFLFGEIEYISPDWVRIDENIPLVATDLDQILINYPDAETRNNNGDKLSILVPDDTYEIQFKAVNGEECELIGRFRKLPDQDTVFIGKEVYFGYKEDGFSICTINSLTSVKVYVKTEQDSVFPTRPSTVLFDAIPIYQDEDLQIPAIRGYYAVPNTSPGSRQYRYWNGSQWLGNVVSSCGDREDIFTLEL